MRRGAIKKKPLGRNAQDSVDRIRKSLSVYDDIVFAFLFGSYARGDVTALSDIDIAIFFAGSVSFLRVQNLKDEVSDSLGADIDIVVLNTAAPVIKMQVLKKGIILLNRDARAYNEFFVNSVKEYDDLKRSRKEVEDSILRGRIYA